MYACRFKQTICHADFSQADFKYVNLQDCEFLRCTFSGAKNLHMTRTTGTILEQRAVRELLVHGSSTEKDFRNLDLHGASFAGMDLRMLDFSNCNLAGCDFSGCKLQEVNFSHANVTGVDFSDANLSGAIIENWNIDAQTRFSNVECDFVWLEMKKTGPGRERNPPLAHQTFQPGEFSKLYQQVSETISFILHNRNEEAAFALALSKLQEEGKTEAQILSLEQKGGSTVVKLGLPPEAEREQEYTRLHAEMQQQQAQIALLQQEQQRLSLACSVLEKDKLALTVSNQHLAQEVGHNRSLLTLLAGRAIQFQQEISMGNNYQQTITGNNNAAAQGTQASANLHIHQHTQPDLAALLQQLEHLLSACQLPAADAKEAAETLHRLQTEHQGEKNPSRVSRWLSGLQDLLSHSGASLEILEQVKNLGEKIKAFF
ncbi:pentapeptide repeat-containing protein [Massilia sp. W12]|uniref:pentapeptide repeat-containing protein n=1 Tax=Massilia sp. W12 TaxID=3126507 RepID=UPI0030CDA950